MDFSPSLDALLARVDALRDEIDAMRPLADEQAGRAMQRLRMEWTYHSNAIEGNSLTYGETRALLMHGVTARGKPLKDHLDIRRHREVIEYLEALVRSDEPLTLAALREMHRMLMGDTYEITAETADGEQVKRTVDGGAFKTQPNNVVTETGETHYYASPEATPSLMTDLVDGLRQSADSHPLVRAALFHHAFAEVHPFPDGNGRTARVLMNLLLMRTGYVPAVIRQERRSAYYGALAAADGGDRQPVVEFVARELAGTMELYLRALRGEPDPDGIRKRIEILKKIADTYSVAVWSEEGLAIIGKSFILPLHRELVLFSDQISGLVTSCRADLFVTVPGLDGNESSVSADDMVGTVESGVFDVASTGLEVEGVKTNPGYSGCLTLEVSGDAENKTVLVKTYWLDGSVEEVGFSEVLGASAVASYMARIQESVLSSIERELQLT